MKVVQLLTHLNWGDAIGNDALAIDSVLRTEGYNSSIMALKVNEKLADRAQSVDFSDITSDDIVLFHKATGDYLTHRVVELPCKKVMIYHNITPPAFILPYDTVMAWNLNRGRRQLKKYVSMMDYVWGDSKYNCRELRKVGAKNVSVRPVFFDINRCNPDKEVLKKLKDVKGNKILFVGRIAPNKKQEDIIKTYYLYKEKYDCNSKLFLVGSWEGMEKYYAKLKGFAADLGLSDEEVLFTGRVTDEEKEAYFVGSDVMVCLSEHEGFCVPILEAMERDLPVIGFSCGAVPETMGNNGFLIKEKNYDDIAGMIALLCRDQNLRAETIIRQRKHLKKYSGEVIKNRFMKLLWETCNEKTF